MLLGDDDAALQTRRSRLHRDTSHAPFKRHQQITDLNRPVTGHNPGNNELGSFDYNFYGARKIVLNADECVGFLVNDGL